MYKKSDWVVSRVFEIRVNPPLKQRQEGLAFVQSASGLGHTGSARDNEITKGCWHPKTHIPSATAAGWAKRKWCLKEQFAFHLKSKEVNISVGCGSFQLLPTLRPHSCHHSHENNMFSCCRAPYASPNANVYITTKKMCSVIIHPEGETIVVISRVTEYTESSNYFSTLQRVHHHQCKLI